MEVAAGWYPDPTDPRLERQWDGRQWTDNVRYARILDAMVTVQKGLTYKQLPLLVTVEGIRWRDEDIRWADITDFGEGTGWSNHFPIHYSITLWHGGKESRLEFAHPARNEDSGPLAYEKILGHLRDTFASRRFEEMLPLVERGDTIRIAGVVLSPKGIGKDGKGDLVPWSEFAGAERGSYEGTIFLNFFRMKGSKKKRAFTVNKVHMLGAWLIPWLADEHVQRYAPQMTTPTS